MSKVRGRSFTITKNQAQGYGYAKARRGMRANPGVTTIAAINGRGSYANRKSARSVMGGLKRNARPAAAKRALSASQKDAFKRRMAEGRMAANRSTSRAQSASSRKNIKKAQSARKAWGKRLTRGKRFRVGAASYGARPKATRLKAGVYIANKRATRIGGRTRAESTRSRDRRRDYDYQVPGGRKTRGPGGKRKKKAGKTMARRRKRAAGPNKARRSSKRRRTSKSTTKRRVKRKRKSSARRKAGAKKTVRRKRRRTAKKATATKRRRRRAKSSAAPKRKRRRKAAKKSTPRKRRRSSKSRRKSSSRRRKGSKRRSSSKRRKSSGKRRSRKAASPKRRKSSGKRRSRKGYNRKPQTKRLLTANRRRRHRRNGRRGFRMNGVGDVLKLGAVVFGGYALHRVLSNMFANQVLTRLLPAPAPVATSGFSLSENKGILASLFVGGAGAFVAHKVIKNAETRKLIMGGLIASTIQGVVMSLLKSFAPSAADALAGPEDGMAARLSAMYGVRGLGAGASIMPRYAPINGVGEYFREPMRGLGEYFREPMNGVGEYIAATNGLGTYEPNGDLFQAAAGFGSHEYNGNHIDPSGDLDRQLTIAEAAAGVGALSPFEAAAGIGPMQAAAGFGAIDTVASADTWIPGEADPQLWAGVKAITNGQSANELTPAGVLQTEGGQGIFG